MNPLARVAPDSSAANLQRSALLARPREFFMKFFHGRMPTQEEKLAWIEAAILRMTALECYENDLYSVKLAKEHPFLRLTVSRRDKQPFKNWKHLQEIKNQLIGPDHEAAELFPAESRLIEGANEYHLWVHADPAFRFPFGFQTKRVVIQESIKALEVETTFAETSRRSP